MELCMEEATLRVPLTVEYLQLQIRFASVTPEDGRTFLQTFVILLPVAKIAVTPSLISTFNMAFITVRSTLTQY